MKNIDFFIAVAYNNRKKNEVIGMAQVVNVNFRMNAELKKEHGTGMF